MDIKNTIRSNRKQLAMTQEQVADYLGVTSSAVYKWEKGSAYPDITILSALARVLKLDMNSLLSFHENLSDREADIKSKEFKKLLETQGYSAAFCFATELIKEYPRCDRLIYGMVMCMKNGLDWFGGDTESKEALEYEEQIMELFYRISNSETDYIRDSAQYMIFYHHVQHKEYELADKVLGEYKGEQDQKEQMQISLYLSQDKKEDARLMLEHKLLKAAGNVQSTLSLLQGMCLKENDLEKAFFLADTGRQVVEVLGLWKYGKYSTYLEIYIAQKDTEKIIETIRGMFEYIEKPWHLQECPLYSHIPVGEQDGSIQKQMKSSIINMLFEEENFKFLEESEKGSNFLMELKKEI